MSGSLGKSESESESASNFNQKVWPGQASALTNMYNQGNNLYGQTNNQLQGAIPGAVNQQNQVFDTANPAWQNQLGGGATQNMGLQNQLTDSLTQSLNNPSAMSEMNAMIMGGSGNNYADALKSNFLNDAQLAQQRMMSNTNLGALDAGQSGSSRHGIQQALGNEGILSNLQNNMTNVGYNSFEDDLDRKLDIASQADQGTLARQQLMGNMIGGQNQAQQSAVTAGSGMQNLGMGQFAPMMMPWQSMGNYANVLGQPTVLGSGSMAGDSDSKGFSMAGGM